MADPMHPDRTRDGAEPDPDSHRETVGSDAPPPMPRPGERRFHPDHIGPFRIIGQIGEGAMGIVYEAEQERPNRHVALKIVRPGVVPGSLLRRFELEYEFLGRLHHPGIAQIFQAGVDEGPYGPQPYFAMELVRGRRLDEYVREAAPGLRERLVLVAAIADAVQHAHHRGVIHRDLKPANILVTDAGDPKVLDFGLARAAQTDVLATMKTAAGEVLGTVAYMSPEQIAGDIASLDTRSDVYALGVILYEVLAERLPYELDRKSFPEALRIIQDTEPTRLSVSMRRIPADVETIVSKALEKDKERRYSSAAELAEDIRHFLRDEPIVARRPSAAYQVQKFARRHKAIVAGIAACVVALLLGLVATSWQAVRARRAERDAQARAREAETEKAKAQAVSNFLTGMLTAVDPAQARGREISVREALDAAAARIDGGAMAGQPEVEVAVRNEIGSTYGSLGVLDAAERQLRASLAVQDKVPAGTLTRAETDARLVTLMYQAGKYPEAETFAREALDLRRKALGEEHVDVASSMDDLGAILMARGDAVNAEPLMRSALAIRRKLLPPDDPRLSVGLNNLAYVMWRTGKLDESERLYREALDIDRRKLGNDHPEIPTRLLNLAVLLRDKGQPEQAEPLAREALAIRRKILGDEHHDIADALDTLAGTLDDRGANAEAEPLLRQALAIARRVHGEVNLNTARLQHNLGWVLWKEGQYADAEPLLRNAVATIPKTFGPKYRGYRQSIATLSRDLHDLGDMREAEARARESLALYRDAPTDYAVVSALIALGQALIAQGRQAEALPALREAVDTAQKHPQPRVRWLGGDAQSTLGEALAPSSPAEAEKLLMAGYESLRDTPSAPPTRVRASIGRLVDFYESRKRLEEAAPWRSRLQRYPAPAPSPSATGRRPPA